MTYDPDRTRGDRVSDSNSVNRSRNTRWQELREEYAAALAAHNAARTATNRMADTGIPIAYLASEFLAEERARKGLATARRRLSEFEASEVTAHRSRQRETRR